MDGIAATQTLREALPGVRVLIVTTFNRPGYLRSALDAGASGFIVKDSPAEHLAEAVRRVAAGLRVIDPALAEESLILGPNPLSAREVEVLRLVESGMSVARIATTVFLTPGTVRNVLSAAINKVGAENSTQAARLAANRGWL